MNKKFLIYFLMIFLAGACKAQVEENMDNQENKKIKTIIKKDASFYAIGFLDGDFGKKQYNIKIDTLIPLYDSPGGKPVRRCRLFKRNQASKVLLLLPEGLDYETLQNDSHEHYFRTGHQGEFQFMKYYSIKNRFVEVLKEKGRSYWIDFRDLTYSMRAVTFTKYIARKTTWQLYDYDGLDLRSRYYPQSQLVVQLSEKQHVIKKFINVRENWAEAIIYEVRQQPEGCYSEDELLDVWTGNVYKGWLKITDDNGQLNMLKYRECSSF